MNLEKMFMKKLSIKNIYLLATAALVTSLSGCKKIDDLVIFRDPQAMDSQIWEQEAAVQYLLNDTYAMIMPVFPYEYTGNAFSFHLASDENYFSGNDATAKKVYNFGGPLIGSDEPRYLGFKYAGSNYGENRYFDVAKCNLAIKNLPLSKSISDAAKKKMLGQFFALRGLNYFGLTKIYGGMPLVLEPQDPQNLKLEGRKKARVMFEQIIKDYDSAMVYLEGVKFDPATERGKLDKLQVLCLKAQALKWWASPLFNPNGDQARWQKAFTVIEEAYNAAVKANYKLMADYSKIFSTEGTNQTEAIIVRSYSPTQPKKFQNVESRSRPASEGGNPHDCYNPSKIMLDAYTLKDGRPISDKTGPYRYDDTLFWLNRDPRFDATFVWNGAIWPLSGKPTRRQWTYSGVKVDGTNESTKPLYVKRFSNAGLAKGNVASANDIGGNGYDWIEYRFAELILDYAEAANETGDMTLAKNLVRAIRKRAGIEEGTPASNDYGLAIATNKDEMRDLILNERMVEFAFEGKRPDDLRRTRRAHLLKGTITQMVQLQPVNGNTTVKELETLIGANAQGIDPNLYRRDTININNKETLLKYWRFPYAYAPPSQNGDFNFQQQYYFWSLSNQFLNSSPLLEQTAGWEGGTFDPLSE
jgi:starch-binding outer membrane protein, SusD/RagB family